MIYVESKKRNLERLQEQYPNAIILDLTSTSTMYAQILSPFYPHKDFPIPVPFSPGVYSYCVEGIWQGLKVFEDTGIDLESFKNCSMVGLKRTVRKYGYPKGHQKGINSTELLNYFDARMLIYLPSYKWVLDNIPAVHNIIMRIAEQSKVSDIVFLDYNTNTDFRDTSSPISHAGLVKLYIEGLYPKEGEEYLPMSNDEIAEKKVARKKSSKSTRRKSSKNESKQLSLFE